MVPANPTIDDSVTIVFDASQGNAALVGQTDVFAHCGLIGRASTDLGNWLHQKSQWNSGFDTTILMTPLGNNRHQIGFVPRTFFGCSSAEDIRAMAFVFRNAAGTLAGKNADQSDIHLPIFPDSNFSAILWKPLERPRILSLNTNFPIEVRSNEPALITVFQDGIPFAQSSGLVSQFNYSLPASNYGKYRLSFTADNGTQVVSDSTYYIVQAPVTIAALPQGTRDGINYINDSTVVLVLLAPQKSFSYVIGEFNDWEMDPNYFMNRTPDGERYWLEITGLQAGKEYPFQYFVDQYVKIGDPYAEKVLDPWNDNGVNSIVYPNLIPYPTGKTTELVTVLQTAKPAYNWQVNNFQRPDNRDLVIYELLVRDFVIRHDYATLIDSLDYLEKLGVNAIELMPVNEFDGNQSWGYGPAYYFAPDKYYGTEAKLKEFIDECHARGIAVILDVVFNHAFGQSPLVRLYQDRATGEVNANNPWLNISAPHPLGLGYDFDHESSYTQMHFDSVLSFWAQEYRVDGFRLDLSKGFTNTNTGQDIGLWSQYDQSRVNILKRMSTRFWNLNFGKYFILEHFANNDEETELANHGMMLWGKASEEYYQGGMGYEPNSDFSWYMSYQSRGWSYHNLVGFFESHDEERAMFQNIAYGNNSISSHNCRDTTVALKRMAMLAAFWATIPGPKMMWQFGELGYDYSLNFGCRTCPKPIRWDYWWDTRRQLLFKKYAAIIKLKTEFPDAFRSSSYDISAWGKQKQIHVNSNSMNVTVIGNFDVVNTDVWTGFQHTGRWYNYMAGDSLEVTNVNMTIPLTPGDFRIFTDQRLPKPDLSVSTLPVGLEEEAIDISLNVWPNPFPEETRISFFNPSMNEVGLEVFDLQGSLVSKIDLGLQNAGEIEVVWNPRSKNGDFLPNGLYGFRLKVGEQIKSGKLILQH